MKTLSGPSALLPERAGARGLAAAIVLAALVVLLGQQGARLGPWFVPSWAPAWWAFLLVLLALGWLPRAVRPAPARPLLVLAAVLVLLGWPLLRWREAVARPALALPASVRSLDQPQAGSTHLVINRDSGRVRLGRPWRRLLRGQQEFVVEAEGWLWAPRTSTYRFELEATGEVALAIDGRTVLRQASGSGAADVPLERGGHAIQVQAHQRPEARHLVLSWDRPGWLELVPLDGYLAGWKDAATAAGLSRRRRATLASLALAWVWAVAAAVVLVRAAESRHAWPAVLRRELRWRAWVGERWADPDRRWPVWVFAGAAVSLFALEAAFRARAVDGVYFQPYTSEYLMQTVSVLDLRDEPWRSLFYLHIQPPALDALRALLARDSAGIPDEMLLRRVDGGIYACWAVVYAALLALVCRWLCLLTSRPFALLATGLLALHPALIFYATLVDSTLLSAALFCWFCFELWRWAEAQGSTPRLAASLLALFFTRSVFQWHFLMVVAASLLLLRAPWRRTARLLAATALVMGLYVGKQYWVFGITLTSTFAADSFCKGVASYCHGTTPVELPDLPPPERARVLSRTAKLGGHYNYNQRAFLERSFSQMVEYRALLRGQPIGRTLATWAGNVGIYLRPSSRYTPHLIVDALPWRSLYDRLLSGWSLVLLVAAAALAAVLQHGPRRTLGLALPGLYVLAVTVVFEGGENMRYKFFVEPTVCVFLLAQAHRLGRALRPLAAVPAVTADGRSDLR